MKIAILGPSPIPYGLGGMEYLLWGLYDHINKDTSHKAELVKVPTNESDFWNIIESYKKFYNLNLDHFDMVITTKYPAWMIRHKNQICYMAHRLRGVYDTYHFTNLPTKVNMENPYIAKIVNYTSGKDSTIDGLFELLDGLYKVKEKVPKEHFNLPSPFLRNILHFLDDKALSQQNIKKYYSISKTVKNRREYFPEGASVEVIYPPSFLPKFKNNNYEYLFTISRLDGPKRINLMIEAMKDVKEDIKLLIAGTGPMEQELKNLAKQDKRIQFLGFVNDDDAIEYYSNAKGILYLPYDEDYGLVTIEAMMCSKPVITCNDSGGTNEFVKDGYNGYIAKPNAKSISEKINILSNLSNEEICRIGENSYNTVKNITWRNTVNALTDSGLSGSILTDSRLPAADMHIERKDKRKIVVTTTFPIYPPQGGGQARVYNLYKNLTSSYDVDIVSFTNSGDAKLNEYISPNMKEIRIPKSIKHQEKEWDIERNIGFPVTDIAMPRLSGETPEYGENLKSSIKESSLVILSHPYLLKEVKNYIGGRDFIYEAQDVEYYIKKELLPKTKLGEQLLEDIYRAEKECCERSIKILTCSQEDKEKIISLYKVPEDKIMVVPNGVDITKTRFTSIEERLKYKKELNIQGEKIAIFMGSWHKPNLEACEYIFDIASKLPDIKFLLLGSQCLAFNDRKLPPNVGLLGVVEEDVKQRVFDIADIALNPMVSGSGTNLKMFDYMAAGIPVISTSFGTRGIAVKDVVILSEVNEMPKVINDTLNKGHITLENMINRSRKYIEEEFDWKKISQRLLKEINLFEGGINIDR